MKATVKQGRGKGFWQLSLPLGELHRWMHSFQSHHTAWETKSYHRTSQGFQPLRCALPQRGRLDRNRCDNKWPLELHPESCWPFPESCSSSWVPGFSLEALRSWHIAKKDQQQEIEKQSVRSKERGDRTTVHTYLKILPLFLRIKIAKSKKRFRDDTKGYPVIVQQKFDSNLFNFYSNSN